MDERFRQRFDERLERILEELPEWVLERLEETPVIVEDRPSAQLLRRFPLGRGEDLCGLFSGVPLTERSVDHGARAPDSIWLFREGITALAVDEAGRLDGAELDRQIRITLLHEIGHLHGLSEDDLTRLGYE